MSWIDRFFPWRRRPSAAARSTSEYVYFPAPADYPSAPERSDRMAVPEAPPLSDSATDAAWLADLPTPPKAAEDEPLFPRFHTTAGDQFETGASDFLAVVRSRLRNIYTPAQPVADRRNFAGRTKLMTTLIGLIEDQRLHTVIYGERGIGKTSMLQVLSKAAEEARYLVVYVTCGSQSEFDETFRTIASRISLRYHRDFGPRSVQAEQGETLAKLLPAEPIAVRAASEFLVKIEGTRVLVILDEYDRAESVEFRRSIAELLKALSDQSARVQFLIAGVAANLTELVENVPSIQRNVYAMRMPKMTPDEVRRIVKNGESGSQLRFDDAAVEAIVNRSMGFPYLATLLSQRSGLRAVDHNRLAVSESDVRAATEMAVEEFKVRVTRRSQLQIDDLVAKGYLPILGALAGAAQGTGGWFSADDLNPLRPGVVGDSRAVAEKLSENHLLLEAGDDGSGRGFRFTESTVPIYLWLLAAQGNAEELAQTRPASETA